MNFDGFQLAVKCAKNCQNDPKKNGSQINQRFRENRSHFICYDFCFEHARELV